MRLTPHEQERLLISYAAELARRTADYTEAFANPYQAAARGYVDDVIDAILTASRNDVEGAINLGTGTETSLLDLLGALALNAPNGNSFEPTFAEKRPGEVKRISIDPARAALELGWTATTSLDTGLKRTLDAL